MIETIGVAIAVVLAMNIGANNSGVWMAPAFGSGLRRKGTALVLFAIFAALGAVTLGAPVVRTVGHGLFTTGLDANPWLFLVLAPTLTITIITVANLFKLPVPTTPTAICSLIGVGLFFGVVRGSKVVDILLWWGISPLASLVVTWTIGRILVARFPMLLHPELLSARAKKRIGILLTLTGCYSAFAIGANNVANAMGPLVGAGTVGILTGTVLAGLAFAAGSVLWGGRVLETVGKGITELCHVRALVVGFVGATGMLAASFFGAPISGALIVTSGVIGFSLATSGARSTAENRNVRRIMLLWATGPALTVLVSFALVWMSR